MLQVGATGIKIDRDRLHVSAYSATIRCVDIRRNCRAFRATAIGVFIFTMFLNEVNVVTPSMPHVLSL
jgi:hypothetical protein